MHKRRLHHILVRLRSIRAWYFVVAIAVSATIAVIALRQNNITAVHLRDNVLAVDEKNGDV